MGDAMRRSRKPTGRAGVLNVVLMRRALDVDGITCLPCDSFTCFTLQSTVSPHFLLRIGGLALSFIHTGQQEMNRWLVRTILLGQEQVRQRVVLLTQFHQCAST